MKINRTRNQLYRNLRFTLLALIAACGGDKTEMQDVPGDSLPSIDTIESGSTDEGTPRSVTNQEHVQSTTKRVCKQVPKRIAKSQSDALVVSPVKVLPVLMPQSDICSTEVQSEGIEITPALRRYVYECIAQFSHKQDLPESSGRMWYSGSSLIPLNSTAGNNAGIHACFKSLVTQSSQALSNEERLLIAKSIYQAYTGSDSHVAPFWPRRRTRWLSEVSGIAPLADSRFFIAYNPRIFSWFREEMIPAPSELIGDQTAQSLFDLYLKDLVHWYAESYAILRSKRHFNNDIRELSKRLFTTNISTYTLVHSLADRYTDNQSAYRILKSTITPKQIESIVLFWVRSHLDGSAADIWELIGSVLRAYDPDFLDQLFAAYELVEPTEAPINFVTGVLTSDAVSTYYARKIEQKCTEGETQENVCEDIKVPAERVLSAGDRTDLLNCAYSGLDNENYTFNPVHYSHAGPRWEAMRLLGCMRPTSVNTPELDIGFTSDLNVRRIADLSGLPVVADGGGTLLLRARAIFRRFNPAIIRWGIRHLMPDPDEQIGKHKAQWFYDNVYRHLAKIFVESYIYLHSMCSINTEVERYKSAIASGRNGLNYLQEFYFQAVPIDENDKVLGANSDWTREMAIGFWLRREMDGTADILWEGIHEAMERFDPGYMSGLESRPDLPLTAPTASDVIPGEAASNDQATNETAESAAADPISFETVMVEECTDQQVPLSKPDTFSGPSYR